MDDIDTKALLTKYKMIVRKGRPLTDMQCLMVDAELATLGYRIEGRYMESFLTYLGDTMAALMEVRGVVGKWEPLFKGDEGTGFVDEDLERYKVDIVRAFMSNLLAAHPYVPRTSLRNLITSLWDDGDTLDLTDLWGPTIELIRGSEEGKLWKLEALRSICPQEAEQIVLDSDIRTTMARYQ